MKKIILNLDENTKTVTDNSGCHIGTMTGEIVEVKNIAEITLQLVKQGVTVDEIIKLQNADLL